MALALVCGITAVSCADEAEAPGPDAAACAALVAFHRGAAADVTSHASKPGRVRIEYRSGADEGVALCEVRPGRDGGFTVTSALVDENRVLDDELAAFGAERD